MLLVLLCSFGCKFETVLLSRAWELARDRATRVVGRTTTTQMLLEARACPHVRDNDGQTPFDWARPTWGDAIPRLCSGKLTGSKAERVVGKRHPSQDGEGTLDSYQHLRLRQAKAEAEAEGADEAGWPRPRLRLVQAEAEAG